MALADADHRSGDGAVLVQDFLAEREEMILLGAVMQRIGAAVRRFDAKAVLAVIAGDEIIERTGRAAIGDGGGAMLLWLPP